MAFAKWRNRSKWDTIYKRARPRSTPGSHLYPEPYTLNPAPQPRLLDGGGGNVFQRLRIKDQHPQPETLHLTQPPGESPATRSSTHCPAAFALATLLRQEEMLSGV